MTARPGRGRPVGVTGLDTLADRLDAAADVYKHAACDGAPTAIFFPDLTKRSGRIPDGGRPDPYADARPICDSCPVRAGCLDLALSVREDDGMWGGLDPDERKLLRRRTGNVTRAR
jgi:WhiB family redox-sensing transcriptional regulator